MKQSVLGFIFLSLFIGCHKTTAPGDLFSTIAYMQGSVRDANDVPLDSVYITLDAYKQACSADTSGKKLPVLPISPFVESYGKSFTDSSGRYKLPFGSLNYAPNIQCIRIHFEKQGMRDTTISKTVDITLKIKPPYDTVDVDMVMKKK